MSGGDSSLLHLLRLPGVAAELQTIVEVIPIPSAQIILCFATQEAFLSYINRQIEGLCTDPGEHDPDRLLELHDWVRTHNSEIQDLWVQAVRIRSTVGPDCSRRPVCGTSSVASALIELYTRSGTGPSREGPEVHRR